MTKFEMLCKILPIGIYSLLAAPQLVVLDVVLCGIIKDHAIGVSFCFSVSAQLTIQAIVQNG
jgi:hypothetical protein